MYVKHCRTFLHSRSGHVPQIVKIVLGTPGLGYCIVKHCRTFLHSRSGHVPQIVKIVLGTPGLDSVGYLKGKHKSRIHYQEENKTFIGQINLQYRKNRKKCLNIFQLHPTNTHLHTSQYGWTVDHPYRQSKRWKAMTISNGHPNQVDVRLSRRWIDDSLSYPGIPCPSIVALNIK